LHTAEEQRNRAQELNKNLDSQKIKLMEESEGRHKSRQIELERELADKTSEFEEMVRDIQQRSEEQLQQLKTFYELEKDRLERRL
jgi:hypothetical protein